ncbi:hypothetical protein CC86DRAFT_386014 [Ophiobolus disseminans]|uniref:Uncharacterized protein n=1 Tax=Ophiobolus disseminans TaxID=1469910 RepID=A0A6A6ZL61_9PLEO|nr:hypothetical protein CC86DRAFT_386014 [Ophiobolus disseminans]
MYQTTNTELSKVWTSKLYLNQETRFLPSSYSRLYSSAPHIIFSNVIAHNFALNYINYPPNPSSILCPAATGGISAAATTIGIAIALGDVWWLWNTKSSRKTGQTQNDQEIIERKELDGSCHVQELPGNDVRLPELDVYRPIPKLDSIGPALSTEARSQN